MFVIRWFWLVVRCVCCLLAVCCGSLVYDVRCLLLLVRCALFVACGLLWYVCCLRFDVRCVLLVVC